MLRGRKWMVRVKGTVEKGMEKAQCCQMSVDRFPSLQISLGIIKSRSISISITKLPENLQALK